MAEKRQVTESFIVSTPSKTTTADPVLLDAAELAKRLKVPESWVRNRTRARTPKTERIPCLRLGRYVRFEWASQDLQAWIQGRRG